jgi:hypothetical protein
MLTFASNRGMVVAKLIARQARTEPSRDRDLTATVMCSESADKLYIRYSSGSKSRQNSKYNSGRTLRTGDK